MAILTSPGNMDIHLTTVTPASAHLLKSATCLAAPTVEFQASLRTRSLSISTGVSNTKSILQLMESRTDKEAHEVHEEHEKPENMGTSLDSLPEEVQESILDCLVGNLCSTSSSVGTRNGTRNWNSAMRHPRAKELTNLALVSASWRRIIQERLYRHIRIKGTQKSLETCIEWFLKHTHLQAYVRHVDFWVPVWEQRPIDSGPSRAVLPLPQSPALLQGFLSVLPPIERTSLQPITSVYRLSAQNSALDELFYAVQCVFSKACILTIEGGTCKKPPMVQYFRDPSTRRLPSLPQIRTLVMKGAWNMMRCSSDFDVLSSALPNLKDWQSMYATPKIRPYITTYKILKSFPPAITHLHLCMEGFYSKKTLAAAKTNNLRENHHLCRSLGAVLPQLEALTLSGRVCSQLFISALAASPRARHPRLKSIDIVARNCCRHTSEPWNDVAGICNQDFIKAFEALVIGATASLEAFKDLKSMRIRYVDLDSPHAFMNPYFEMRGDGCQGIWSDAILANLAAWRPGTRFAANEGGPDEKAGEGAGAGAGAGLVLRRRPKNIQVGMYAGFGPLIR